MNRKTKTPIIALNFVTNITFLFLLHRGQTNGFKSTF